MPHGEPGATTYISCGLDAAPRLLVQSVEDRITALAEVSALTEVTLRSLCRRVNQSLLSMPVTGLDQHCSP